MPNQNLNALKCSIYLHRLPRHARSPQQWQKTTCLPANPQTRRMQACAKRVWRPASASFSTTVRARPLVRVHPATGRRALWGSPGYFRPGTAYSGTVSDGTLNALLRATDPVQGAELSAHDRFVLRYGYEKGDLVMWDNYSV